MKRYILPVILLSLLIASNLYSARIKIAKICYVNTRKLLSAHPATRYIIKEIMQTRNKYKSEIQSLEKEVKELENQVKNNANKLSQSEIRSILTKMEAKKEALNYKISKRNNELREIQRTKLKPAYRKILLDIKKYANSLGYNIVIDARFVLIGARDLDITDQLKRIFMNKR